jgi:hypothetical protein
MATKTRLYPKGWHPVGGYNDRDLAIAAAHKRMHKSPEAWAIHQHKAGTALLRQHGVGYFSAMGKASAAARAKARMK